MNLEQQIAKIVEANNATFYDTEIVTEGEQTIYRVYVAQDDGVSLELCADISRELSVFLDVNPPMGGRYTLEVSSPGLERKLTKPIHFKYTVGESIKFKIIGVDKGKGILLSADDKCIVVQTKQGKETYKYDELGTVKTYIDWN
ncbi:MAG: ribosome maturation factor RimP [Sulfurovum sp.]|nr:ribosome maturation factor RimP [Sulfurovum sp.]